jgi:septation ring formation regulator EzrA
MKKRETILLVIAVIVTALAYFSSKQTEKRVQEFIEQKESKEDKKLKLVPLKTILL